MTAVATPVPARDAPASPSQRRLTVGLCVTVVAIAFESIAVATAMPAAAQDLDGLSYYSWSFSVFLVGMLFSTVLAGRLSDRIGPARPLLAGLVVFAAGLVLAGSAQHISQLVAGRLVQGLGSGLINTAIFVCVARAYGDAQRPRMFTYLSASWVLPAFVGPPVAAAITERWSWHWVFLAVIPVVVAGGVMALPELRRLVRQPRNRPEPGGARPAPVWAAAVVALAAVGLQVAGQRLDWTSLPLLVVTVGGLVVALPRLMPGCFSRLGRGLPAVIVVRGLVAGAFVGGEAFVPLMLVEAKDTSLLWAGAALTVGSLGWMAGSWLQSRPWLRLGRDRIITLGCVSVAAGLTWVTVSAVLPATPTWWVAIGWVLAGFGMGLTTASTALAVIWLSRVSEQGRNASSLNLSDALGSAVFVGLSGTLFAALHPATEAPFTFGTVLFTMSAVALLAVAASFRITPLRDPGAVRSEAPAPDPGVEPPHRVRSESVTHEAAGSVTAGI
jgi:MFS family permease